MQKSVTQEIVILIHINLFQDTCDKQEFRELVNSTAVSINKEFFINRDRLKISPKYFISQGKLEEIQQYIQENQIDAVIINQDISPKQEKNLMDFLHCKVLDRTALILDIFAQHAKSFEGKLQVELAQLEHLSTRLVNIWTHLERQKGGIGLRGPGEKQLETDRRLLKMRIKYIKKQLVKVCNQRLQSSKNRNKSNIITIVLVGYTNAGKSTLFNSLTQADVYTADQMFATLDPNLKSIKLNVLTKVVLSDTVGFIKKLPPQLIIAFRATLEQVAQAQLLLHVVDANDPNRHDKMLCVQETLKAIGANDVPIIEVFNKIDLLQQQSRVNYNIENIVKRIWLSAVQQDGITTLKQEIINYFSDNFIYCCIKLNPNQYKLRATLHDLRVVLFEEYHDNDIRLEIKIAKRLYQKFIN